MTDRLQGRTALVTGGLRGIGLAIAERFVAEGATVWVADLKAAGDADAAAVTGRLGNHASYLKLDVAQESEWQAARGAIEAAGGAIDILVNNAGIDAVGPVETMELERWRRLMSINVDGLFLGIKTFKTMLEAQGTRVNGGASVINMSSIMGIVGYAQTSAYNTSKGAVRLMSKALAIEFAQARAPIRVNSLNPGFVQTPLLDIGMQRWVDEGVAEKAQDLVDQLAAATPMGRIARPEEIAAAALFLACEDASYVTGIELPVDGGWTAQ
ncbi:SDR family NAD(P)-dependent oxidoreductase [Sphingomonas profundi]|uniref:SDR family NAD(P)-dependent oxidoreductase n=1 Tax=Alterirhizorhabdus profundi TaxID=2681549 RepID=UPI0012E706ED|nr:glucose 1-dehydrogenase [Sphingomonas profundi]